MASPLLLIEDTASLQMVYKAILEKAGYEVALASTASEGLSQFKKHTPKVILLDLMLPDRDGLDLMADFLELRQDIRVIVITANGSINRAVDAMRAGAYEFLVKPFDEGRLINAIENARRETGAALDEEAPAKLVNGQLGGFIGSSPVMRDVYKKVLSISRSMATVFISGESGTGKEVCALAVHEASNRASGPFVPLNCGAIPSDLLESEVFGHLKGSFTGAIADKMGAAGAADGGTLFLDEICEMQMGLQTKLLRFLQTSSIQPVGAVTPRKVNVRIICATNRDPFEQVQKGLLRQDLFYRLHVIPIHLPPLRDRGNDVVEIAEKTLEKFSKEEGRQFSGLGDDVVDLFRTLEWPGNVRQLLNVMRNIVVLNDGDLVEMSMLPDELLKAGGAENAVCLKPDPAYDFSGIDRMRGRTLAEIEQYVIEGCIMRHGGSVTKAAHELGVSPSTIYRKRELWSRE